jgi:serine/threonine protein phosphatase 1
MFGFGEKNANWAQFPEGRVGFAVGDIHGRADLVALMLDEIEARAAAWAARSQATPVAIFLGDYVDRGMASMAVIDLLLERLQGIETHFLMGNHEQAMLAFMEDPVAMRSWLMHGGMETLAAYGVRPPTVRSEDAVLEEAAQALKAALPLTHLAFLHKLERYLQLGDYVFVHAGVAPGKALEEQTDADLLWIREDFLDASGRLPYRVVHGHTVVATPHCDHRRISIDTGAYATGVLTAVELCGKDVALFTARRDRRGA